MAITDPEVIKYVNEQIRPLAEAVRALDAQMDAADETFRRLNGQIPNDNGEMLEDGRENEGVSRLSGRDIRDFVTVVRSLQAVLNGTDATVEKPTVRPLRVELR